MAAPMSDVVLNILKKISSATENPEEFLTIQKGHVRTFTSTLKTVYDTTKSADEPAQDTEALNKLIVSGFDEEQIWQQLELENESSVANLVTKVARLVTNKAKCFFQVPEIKTANTEVEKSSTKHDKGVSRKQGAKLVEAVDPEEGDWEEEDDDEEGDEEGESENSSDDELSNIKSGLEDVDPDDKFFDFTGDSDDDLNFDFGPLSKKGDVDDEIFGKEDEESDSDDDDNKKLSNKGKSIKKKKSVTFAEDIGTSEKKSNVKKGKTLERLERKKSKGSVVDDKFFKLSELEEFLEREDRKEERRLKRQEGQLGDDADDEEDEDLDMFAEIESDDEDLHYDDFFDQPEGEDGKVSKPVRSRTAGDDDDDDDDDNDDEEKTEQESTRQQRRRDLLADSDSEGEDVGEILGGKKEEKSTFEKRQEKLKAKIANLEKDLVANKGWQMAGEVSGGKRPENSLLQENLQFEYMSRLAPEVTEETTKSLESIIIQRIKDKVWDDVERKTRQKETPFEYKKRIVLDQEKSKLSLGEIYEQEYLKQQQTEEDEEKEDKDHADIRQMMTTLFLKLDALSNFHYTPKQAAPEVKIVSNQPSIMMEEVAPVVVSRDKLLAPEEVQEKPKGEVKGEGEKTSTDKLRERKKKKVAKRERQKERDRKEKLVEKLNPGLGNKYSKEKAMRKLEKDSKNEKSGVKVIKDDKRQKTGLTSSKAFFTQLQDEVTTMIKSKQATKRKKDAKTVTDSKKLKL